MIKSSYMYILDGCENFLALIFFGNTKIYHKYTNKMNYPFPQLFFCCLILWSIYVVGPCLWISIRVHCLRVPDCQKSIGTLDLGSKGFNYARKMMGQLWTPLLLFHCNSSTAIIHVRIFLFYHEKYNICLLLKK